MSWELLQWIAGFTLTAFGAWMTYVLLNPKRKETMANTIESLAKTVDGLSARITTLEALLLTKDHEIALLQTRIDKLEAQLKRAGFEPEL